MPISHLSGRFIIFEVDIQPYAEERYYLEFEIISGSVDDNVTSNTSYLPMGSTFTFHQTQGRTVMVNFQGALLMSNLPWENIPAGKLLSNVAITLNRGGTIADDVVCDESRHFFDFAQTLNCRHTFDTSNHQIWEVSFVAHGTYTPPVLNVA